jgi:hypothetical protein
MQYNDGWVISYIPWLDDKEKEGISQSGKGSLEVDLG